MPLDMGDSCRLSTDPYRHQVSYTAIPSFPTPYQPWPPTGVEAGKESIPVIFRPLAHAPLSDSLIKHKFKDISIKNFKRTILEQQKV